MRITNVRYHLRKGRPVRAHTRHISVKFSDNKVRQVPIINPMRPKDIGEDDVPTEGWIAEEKKDGSLTMQYIETGAVAYLNRRGVNKTDVYPELTDDEATKIKTKGLTVLEGEAYALKGRKDNFENFLKRDLLQNPEEAKARMKKYPLRYEAFDIVMKDGKSVQDKPLSERKELLQKTVPQTKELRLAKIYKDITGTIKKFKKDPTIEGVVLKKLDSKYTPGKSNDWRKLKFRKEADTVIMGYEPGEGKRKEIGVLKVGVWDRQKKSIREVATVGTGFTDEQLADIKKKIDSGHKLFAKVEYLHLGSQGRLRAPSFKGLREDITTQQTHI